MKISHLQLPFFLLKNQISSNFFNFLRSFVKTLFAASVLLALMTSKGWSACNSGNNATTSGCNSGFFCQSSNAGQALSITDLNGTCTAKLATGSNCSALGVGNANDVCISGVCSNGKCYEPTGIAAAQTFQNNVDNNSLVTVLCKAYLLANGTAGKTVAAFAIISAGIGFFTGKVSWGLLIGISIGIGTMFGAPTIVAAISGSSYDTSTCKNTQGVYSTGQ